MCVGAMPMIKSYGVLLLMDWDTYQLPADKGIWLIHFLYILPISE